MSYDYRYAYVMRHRAAKASAAGGDWVLSSGFWNDSLPWVDSENWID